MLLSQLSELLQWTWGQVIGRRMIAEEVSTPDLGASVRTRRGDWSGPVVVVTPFTIWEAARMSMVIMMGMFGCMTMSAITDRGD